MNKMKAITLSTLTGLVTLGLLMVFLGGLNVGLPTAHADIAIDANDVAADAGESSVVINEIMQNPDANDGSDYEGEWFELYNNGPDVVTITEWIIGDNSGTHEITCSEPVTIPAYGYLVLGHTITKTENGTVTVDYEYGNDIQLANGDDELVLTDTSETQIDYVTWTNSYKGASTQLVNPEWDNKNTTSDSWREATTEWAEGTDRGTPGEPNYALVLCAKPMENVPVTTNVRAEFNLEMSGVDSTTFELKDSDGSSVTGTAVFYTESLKAVFTPTEKLDYGTTYTATLSQALTDTRGLTLGVAYPDGYSWSFTTESEGPNLAITKTVKPNKSEVPLGDVVTYTVTIANDGDTKATGVVITDRMPSAVTFGSYVSNPGKTAQLPNPPDDTITWTYPVDSGAHYTFSFTATVTTNTTYYGAEVTNTVAFTSDNAGSGSAEATFAISTGPALLDLSKAVTPEIVDLGDVVTYTISLANDGEAEVTGILLTDTLPSEVAFGDFIMGTNVHPNYASGVITWSGNLPADLQPIAIVFTATVTTDTTYYGAEVVNPVEFTSDNAGIGSAEATFTIEGTKIFLPLVARNHGG